MISDPRKNIGNCRPTDYTPEIGIAICRRLVEGESLRAICADPGMPVRATIPRWLAQHDDFRKSYELAQSLLLDFLQDEIFEIADDASGDWVEKARWRRRVVRIQDPGHLSRCWLRAEVREWVVDQRMPNSPVSSRKSRQK